MNETLLESVECGEVKINNLNQEELLSIGFHKWSNDLPGVLLIPLWAYNLIPDGTELISIFGDKVVKGVDYIDLDTRGGLLAYGVQR